MKHLLFPWPHRHVIMLLALFLLMTISSVACAARPSNVAEQYELGVHYVDMDRGDGALVTIQKKESPDGDYEYYKTYNAGHSWQSADSATVDFDRQLEAITPRGTYRIIPSTFEPDNSWETPLDARIVREVNGQTETVWSMEELYDPANLMIQRWSELTETQLYDIHYHAASGNIFVARGIEGLLRETPEGEWEAISNGRFTPTEFHAETRTWLMASTPSFWFSTLALAVLFAATTVALIASNNKDIYVAAGVVGGLLAAIGFVWDENLARVVILIALSLIGSVAAIVVEIVSGRQSQAHRILALVVVGLMLSCSVFVFPGFLGNDPLSLVWMPPLVFVWVPMILFLATIIPPFATYKKEWRCAGKWVCAMMPLSAFIVALWLQYVISLEVAKWLAVGLAIVLSGALYLWLKRIQRKERLVA